MTTEAFKKSHSKLLLTFTAGILLFLVGTQNISAQDSLQIMKQKAFQEVFGDAVKLDPVMVEKVKSDVHGKRHYLDTNGDGKPNEVWFIDIDPRHTAKNRPILVKVIDENGNLEYGKEPDTHGDLWIADWNADGLVDAVIGYEDVDNDGDVDQMGLYHFNERLGLRVWWFIDHGDDNLLGYTIDYLYNQRTCQELTHFGGNESFSLLYYHPEKKMWMPFWENRFLFYDSDGDGITEEAIRVEADADIMQFLRWSFNVNPLIGEDEVRNFDVGISTYGPGWALEGEGKLLSQRYEFDSFKRNNDSILRIPDEHKETFTIRGIPTGEVIKRDTGRNFFSASRWGRVLMTWDENDLNIAWNLPHDKIPRWEGIIAPEIKGPKYYMPQIGGPSCGPYNKRYELVANPQDSNRFYFNPSDHKIHIMHSDTTWINVDNDGDNKSDMNYTWIDRNKDGVMDQIKIDIAGNIQFTDFIDLDVSKVKFIPWRFKDFNKIYMPVLEKEPENKYNLIKTLTALLEMNKKGDGADEVWDFVENKMRGSYAADLSERMLKRDESMLYYLMLIQDRQIAKLKKNNVGSKSFWKAFNNARSKGDTEAMTKAIKKHFKVKPKTEDYSNWLSNLRAPEEKQRVAWTNEWVPPNWGWESEKMAYRFYDGHFDLFGKRVDTLIYPIIKEAKKSYHKDQNDWGMDILNVGKTSGIGGLTLYVNGTPYPVRKEKNLNDPIFTGRLVNESFDEVTLEFTTNNVGDMANPYTIKIRPSAFAGQIESPVEVVVEGGNPNDKIELGIGLMNLGEEDFFYDKNMGVMGSWGFQDPEIGWIGLGVIFSPERFIRIDNEKDEHRVVVKCERNVPLTYYIKGEWLRGTQFPCCPAPSDWFKKLKITALHLNIDR